MLLRREKGRGNGQISQPALEETGKEISDLLPSTIAIVDAVEKLRPWYFVRTKNSKARVRRNGL